MMDLIRPLNWFGSRPRPGPRRSSFRFLIRTVWWPTRTCPFPMRSWQTGKPENKERWRNPFMTFSVDGIFPKNSGRPSQKNAVPWALPFLPRWALNQIFGFWSVSAAIPLKSPPLISTTGPLSGKPPGPGWPFRWTRAMRLWKR